MADLPSPNGGGHHKPSKWGPEANFFSAALAAGLKVPASIMSAHVQAKANAMAAAHYAPVDKADRSNHVISLLDVAGHDDVSSGSPPPPPTKEKSRDERAPASGTAPHFLLLGTAPLPDTPKFFNAKESQPWWTEPEDTSPPVLPSPLQPLFFSSCL